jgi:hypothetical protein
MDRKSEKTLPTLRDEELSTVAGGSGIGINGDLAFLSNFAKASKGGVATAGTANQVDASENVLSLVAGLLPGKPA